MLNEINERNIRHKNVMIYGSTKTKSETPEERQECDKTAVINTLKTILIDYPTPIRILCLEKYNPEKSRLIKVCFVTREITKQLLKN